MYEPVLAYAAGCEADPDETSLTARSNVADEANVQVVPVDDGELEAAIENGYYIATTADYAKYQKKRPGSGDFMTRCCIRKTGERRGDYR